MPPNEDESPHSGNLVATGLVRVVWLVTGLALTGVAFVGYVVPGMPATVFLLGSLYCFSKSSPPLEAWILNHRWFGPMLSDWHTYRGIRLPLKIRIVAIIALSCLGSSALLFSRGKPLWVAAAILATGAVGAAVVLTRPEPEG